MEFNFGLLLVIIVLALVFDYINGFHDAANAIATVVATKVLSPFQAVLWAAFFNFLAYWVFGLGVADTVAKTAKTLEINLTVILAGILAAIIWNLFTWWQGIPSSSSHTLIGGFAGAAIAHAGFDVVNWYTAGSADTLPNGVFIIIAFIVIAPVMGAVASYFISLWLLYSSKKTFLPKLFTLSLMIVVIWFIADQMVPYAEIKDPRFDSHFWSVVFENHNVKFFIVGFIILSVSMFCLVFSMMNHYQSNYWLKKMQLLSSAAFSLGHGGNDSQKVMGIIGAAIIFHHTQTLQDPAYLSLDSSHQFNYFVDHYFWVPFVSFLMISLGTLSGGWKIVKTMGTRITKVTPLEGVAAETSGAITLFISEHFGIPVSTTHTITGAIIGVGVTKRVSAVRWGITISLLWAWILTIPVSAFVAGVTYLAVVFLK